MRIGFDIDGVLANFIPAYQDLVVEVAGEDRFLPGDNVNPPCWNWPQHRGYSEEVVGEVWKQIIASPSFWNGLGPLEGASTLALVYEDLCRRHDLYFITARPGARAKAQTEEWLGYYIAGMSGYDPTVLISSDKGLCCKALKLDAYIDDNLDNVDSVSVETAPRDKKGLRVGLPTTRTYLLDRNYNQGATCSGITRVRSVGQMLDYELLAL